MTERPAVLVTGAGRRLGAVIARRFSEAGWHVVVHSRHPDPDADAVAASLPSAETAWCDLADADALRPMVSDLAARLRDWRAVIASAAVFDPDDARSLDGQTFDTAMATNARAAAQLAQGYLASANARLGRRFVALTDQKLANPNPDFFSYTMSKHALGGAIAMLAMAAPRGSDRVYALAPGAILASHDQTEAEAERSHRLNLLHRRTDAREVADGCLWLAQGLLASGETLFVDSGQHLMRQPRDVIYLARETA